MSFDENLATRVRRHLKRKADYPERKMFGGLCCMLNGNMCGGVLNDDLIVRVSREEYEIALKQPHTRKFDFTGKPMKGFVVVLRRVIVSTNHSSTGLPWGSTVHVRNQPRAGRKNGSGKTVVLQIPLFNLIQFGFFSAQAKQPVRFTVAGEIQRTVGTDRHAHGPRPAFAVL